MSWLSRLASWIAPETRSTEVVARSLENPAVSIVDAIRSNSYGYGNSLTIEKVAGYPPVAQAVGMIAGDCSSLPLCVYKRNGLDREKQSEHEAHRLINLDGSPNEYTTAFDFWFDFYHDALLRGLGLIWIERRGIQPIALHRLDPESWRPVRVNRRGYWVNYGTPPIVLSESDVIHHSGVRLDGLNPSSPIRRYAETFKVGTSLQKYASSFFDNGAHVGGVLKAPPGASPDAIKNVEEGVYAKANPMNWFKTLILRDGFEFIKTSASPKEASVGEIDEAETRHVAQIYNVPPSRLGLKDSVAYNSLEQEEKRYIRSTCGPHLKRVMAQCNRKLLRPSEMTTHFVEYLIDALQWTDGDKRASIATQGIQAGWLMPNEVRRWHNLPQIDGLDDKPKDSRESDSTTATATKATEEVEPAEVDEAGGIAAQTTLNGAQITAVLEVLDKLQSKALVEDAAIELLVGVGLPREVAQTMLDAQRNVQPIADPTTQPGPNNDQA